MKKCLDATCNGTVELLSGKNRCNSCGIVQTESLKETLTFLDKEVRTESEINATT